jgi:AraC-like DNA-binding protein
MDVVLKPVERLLFASGSVLLAEYHCAPDDALFANSGPTNAHSIVFPLTTTRIVREGITMLELPTVVTLYNKGVEYSSQAVSREGSHCQWMTLDVELLSLDEHRPFAQQLIPIDASLVLRQRRLFRFAQQFDVDALTIEEECVDIAEQIVGRHERTGTSAPLIIERTREFLAARFTESLSLAGVASAVGVSAAHLSRAFRHATGNTMHQFREELRLRRALDLLPDFRGDFTRLALDLGFSSHSHFTDRFHRRFHITPAGFVESL